MIKKVMVSLTVLVMVVFLVGCLDYKAYDVPADDVTEEDLSLIDEIANIEEQLNLEEDLAGEDLAEVEDIILPDLTEEVENVDVNEAVILIKEMINLRDKLIKKYIKNE